MEALLRRLMVRIFSILPQWMAKWAVYTIKRKYVIGVVAYLPNERGEFLFLRHTYRRKRPWRLPGGLKEAGEDAFATIVRELKEEANLVVRPLQVIGVTQSDITLDICVMCELLEERPFVPNEEIDAFMWVDPFAAPFPVPRDQLELIRLALRLRDARVHENWPAVTV